MQADRSFALILAWLKNATKAVLQQAGSGVRIQEKPLGEVLQGGPAASAILAV